MAVLRANLTGRQADTKNHDLRDLRDLQRDLL